MNHPFAAWGHLVLFAALLGQPSLRLLQRRIPRHLPRRIPPHLRQGEEFRACFAHYGLRCRAPHTGMRLGSEEEAQAQSPLWRWVCRCPKPVLFVLTAEATRNQPIDVDKTVGQNREFLSGL